MKWYVLYVKTGKEEEVKTQVQRYLDKSQCHCFIPKRKVPERKEGKITHVIKIMFPGYVFLNVSMNFSLYYQIVAIPGVYSLLNYSNKKDINFQYNDGEYFFKFIPDGEMNKLLALVNLDNDVMEYSTFLLEEDKIKILAGPLIGMEGYIKKIDRRKQRAKLEMDFMGVKKIIDIGFESLDTTFLLHK